METEPKPYDVIVLGAGAAGLLCAITAARRGRRVLVLEKANKVGKKILMSGGGRCNFTNQVVEAENYISDNPHFCKAALSRYTQWDFLTLVERHGIDYEERKHGQLFCQHSARDILDMLLEQCQQAGVQIRTGCDIDTVESLCPELKKGDTQDKNQAERYRVKFILDQARIARKGASQNRVARSSLTVDCQSLVVATGALSIPTLGGSGMGYDLARQFGLTVTRQQAGLVPFMFSDAVIKALCERLSGVSLPVEVSCNGQSFTESMLFTHRGISGPAILQISNYWQPGNEISINLLPELDARQWLLAAKQNQGKTRLKTLLHQNLARALVDELLTLGWLESVDAPLAGCSDKQLIKLGLNLNHWRLKPSATEGYRTAEVTLGGVNTSGLSSKTMETREHPGLFFIGEVLDVTGQLGGFNFQWAWSSGYSAGLFA